MVRISRPFQLMDATTIIDYVQFTDKQALAHLWTMTTAKRLKMDIPFPIHNVEAINLPLRIALARMVFGVINDDIDADAWYAVTSLVKPDDLIATFPTERRALTTSLQPIHPLTHLMPGVATHLDVDFNAPDAYQRQLEEVELPLHTALYQLQRLRTPRSGHG